MDETSSVAAVATHSSESAGRSPLATFILEDLESRRDELNTFSAAKSHIKLLVDAARRQRLRAQKIGWTSTSTFALYRSGPRSAASMEESPHWSVIRHSARLPPAN